MSGNPSQKSKYLVRKIRKQAIEGKLIDAEIKEFVKTGKAGRQRVTTKCVRMYDKSLLVGPRYEATVADANLRSALEGLITGQTTLRKGLHVATAATLGLMLTGHRDAVGCGVEHPHDPGPRPSAIDPGDLGHHSFAGQGAFDEDHPSVGGPGDPGAVARGGGDAQFHTRTVPVWLDSDAGSVVGPVPHDRSAA